MRRGPRRRFIVPGREALAWVPSGRWGPRRVRVSECHALTAEAVYTEALRAVEALPRPGERRQVMFSLLNQALVVDWELRPNAVWRFGRVFLFCSICKRRVTRLYVPRCLLQARCRVCWGLSYPSQQNSYRRTGLSAVF